MASTFETTRRLIECANCGAPAAAKLGDNEVNCAYCGHLVFVGARPNDGEQPESAAEEIARLRQLASQRHLQVGRSRYDLSQFPKALAELGVDAKSSAKKIRAAAMRLGQRSDDDAQIARVWVAVVASRRLYSDGELERARAHLETALGWAGDAGHRDLIRCELVRLALRAKEVEAAEGWLAECTAAPIVLELDSAHRYARALVALAHQDDMTARELLGEPEEMPVATSHIAHFTVARAQCALLRGQEHEADAIIRREYEHLDEIIEVSHRDELASPAVASVAAQRDETRQVQALKKLREQDVALAYSRSPYRVLVYAGWLALAMGILFGVAHAEVNAEPLHRGLMFPRCQEAAVMGGRDDVPPPPYRLEYMHGVEMISDTAFTNVHCYGPDDVKVATIYGPSLTTYLYFFAGYTPFASPFALLLVVIYERGKRSDRHKKERALIEERTALFRAAGKAPQALLLTRVNIALMAVGGLPLLIGFTSFFTYAL